ncbi:Suppressor of Yeast Profilin deletion [Scheffersomyces stipitis CBS 6054]|uniref:Suppressor of Yeast Profilin deletion n=1 Tax=Scheffersomyces stipitis (strain ATCC 58785 / CBS 6054 / NBRC 10063 / NRRL Y-11545) TaxID=322104 RepID=A3LSR1_PICST|nr:Suppressor of Yeast Profilin deletion [Scheffersomyces stipitis CBS 6054]ABN65939.2 Suppressor of Yeast Profilin deletion [Scheffersomyces stipitis CBS 6054]
MSEDSFNYPTSILTSKTPEQAAKILPNGLNSAYKLLDTDLSRWFKEYASVLQTYNSGLRSLLATGNEMFKESNNDGEFSNFPRHWNCFLASLQIELNNNDELSNSINNEIIRPLRDVVDKDVRLSELLINSQELQEISDGLKSTKSNAEMQWNYKAPQIFQNWEDFKKYETQLLFDIVLNYFQSQNSKLTKELTNNENSTNYLLKNFKLDNEMQFHLEWLLHHKFEPAKDGFVQQQQKQQQHQLNKQSHPQQRESSQSHHPSKRFSKSNKLKSRVGSIFGRSKNKRGKAGKSDTIPETESITSETNLPRGDLTQMHTRASSITSRGNSYRRPSGARTQSSGLVSQPASAAPEKETPHLPSSSVAAEVGSSTVASEPSIQEEPPVAESPNVVKYKDTDSSSDEEGPEDIQNNGRSMLQKHDLEPEDEAQGTSPRDSYPSLAPPPQLPDPRSRQSSSGKYSFEAGDDQKPIAATPRSQSENVFESPPESELPEPNLHLHLPPERLFTIKQSMKSEVTSQMFHNLPSARESLVQPHATGGSFAPLVSQDTGMSSLSKSDYFKHFDTGSEPVTKGLNASIADVVNANFKDGQLVKSQLIGEVAFTYIPEDATASLPVEPILVRIPNSFDKVILNNSFVDKLEDEVFKISPALVSSKTLGGIKYLLKLNETQVPIIVQQVWRYEDHQASLVVKLRVNPAIREEVVVENLFVSVALKSNVQATSASSKPQGAFNKEKNRITWRYTQPLKLGGDVVEEKLIARFMTNGKGVEDEAGVQLKFLIHDHPIKFATIYSYEDKTKEIASVRNITSGNYSGHA